MATIQTIPTQEITKPDILYKFELIKQIQLIRTFAVQDVNSYARSIDVLKILLTPYIDTIYKQDEEAIENIEDIKRLKRNIEYERNEELKNKYTKEYLMKRYDLILGYLLKLLDRLGLLLEISVSIDLSFAEDIIDDEDDEDEEKEIILESSMDTDANENQN
jgi:hypothetical protein